MIKRISSVLFIFSVLLLGISLSSTSISSLGEQDLLTLPAGAYGSDREIYSETIRLHNLTAQILESSPTESVALRLSYQIWSPEEFVFREEVWRLYLIYSWITEWPPPEDYYTLLFEDVIGEYPSPTSKTSFVSFEMPNRTGTYYIWFAYSIEPDTIKDFLEPLPLPAHIKIIVIPRTERYFEIKVKNPVAVTVGGIPANYTIKVSAVNGYQGTISLGVDDRYPGMKESFTPQKESLTIANTSFNSRLNIMLPKEAKPTRYKMIIVGCDGYRPPRTALIELILDPGPFEDKYKLGVTLVQPRTEAGSSLTYLEIKVENLGSMHFPMGIITMKVESKSYVKGPFEKLIPTISPGWRVVIKFRNVIDLLEPETHKVYVNITSYDDKPVVIYSDATPLGVGEEIGHFIPSRPPDPLAILAFWGDLIAIILSIIGIIINQQIWKSRRLRNFLIAILIIFIIAFLVFYILFPIHSTFLT